MRRPALLAWWLALLPALAGGQTRVENTATLRYVGAGGGAARTVASNTVTLDVAPARLPSRVAFHAPPPGAGPAGARCADGGATLAAGALSPAALAAAPARTVVEPASGMVIAVEAPGSNRDAAAAETLTVTLAQDGGGGAATTVILAETAPASGVFAGTLPAASTAGFDACRPVLNRGERIVVRFAGDAGSDPSSATALVDPSGVVFDSATGAPVDGAEVTLVDEAGRPARVVGDDGVSAYPATVTSGGSARDAGGRDYAFAPGGYRFPLAAPGVYRLRVVAPAGYAAPSRAPPAALAALRDPAGRPFALAPASTGGTLTLVSGEPLVVDIPLDRAAAAALSLDIAASLREASAGDLVQFRLHLANRGAGDSGPLHLSVAPPRGLRYRPGSLRGGGIVAQDRDGRLDVTLASLAPGGAVDLSYLASVTPDAPQGEAVTDAVARGGGGLTSNPAAASVRIRAALLTDALTILGRVTAGGCGLAERDRPGIAGARVLLEDGSAAITDRDGLYHLEGVRPGRHVVALDTASLPGMTPVDCAADTRAAGSATSRFVEGMGGLVRRADFVLRERARPVPAAPPASALRPEVASDAVAAGDRDWLAGRAPGIAWLFPDTGYNPRAPVTRVAIAHRPGQRVALTIEGRPVDPLAYDTTDSDPARGVAVSRWVGIPLAPGANHLAARVLEADGRVAATLERTVAVSGPAHGAALDLAHSRLVADGVAAPLVAVRVTDAAGRPVRAGTPIPFLVAAPYAAAGDAARPTGDAGRAPSGVSPGTPAGATPGATPSAPVVGDDGLAFLPLAPTTAAGAVRLALPLDERRGARPVAIEAWLAAAPRPWTVVGYAAGSAGYDVLARHAQRLPLARRGARPVDGELALYAKGRIRGRWLLTLMVDSGRTRDAARGIGGLPDPDRWYTVYGDAALQGADAATQGRLYVRLETPTFLALFGDARTGLTQTQLTRYDRVVEGARAEWRGRRWHAVAFAARPDTVAGRDEIQGAGLTGPYRLAVQHIVAGSDRVRVEVRDRLRGELVVSSTPMARHLDYDIDPVAGTLRFAAPVLSRDAAGDPVFIVAEYEVEAGAARAVAGGRIARRIGGAVEVGASALADRTLGDGRVAGADVKAVLGATTLAGEVAAGGWHGLSSGTAFLAEATHRGPRLDLAAYVRQQALGFGLGQQSLAEAGSRRVGADLAWRIADGLAATATAWRQQMLATPGERTAGEARIDWTRGLTTLFAGVQVADDTGLDGGDRHSRLLTLGARQVAAGGAVTVEGRADLAPGGERASVDFPERRQVTVAWRVAPRVRLLGGWETDIGAGFTTRTLRAGVELSPWSGGTATLAAGGQDAAAAGARRYAQVGLAQSLPLGPRWTLDATLDSTRTLAGAIAAAARVSPFQPAAAAGALGRDAGDYAAATLGASYRAGDWSGRGRAEYRDGAIDTRIGVTLDALRALGAGRTLAAGWRSYVVRQRGGGTATSLAGDVALAWRPLAGGWSWLDRLAFRHDHGDPAASAAAGTTLGSTVDRAGGAQATTRIADNLAIDWRSRPDGRGGGTEVAVYYGAKYVRGRYDGEVAAGLVDATAIEIRQGIGRRIDVGAAASVLHGWTDRVVAWSGGPSVGVSPAGDLWLSAGWNVAGYRDRDLAGDRYTRRGPYVTLRAKFDAHRLGALFGRGS